MSNRWQARFRWRAWTYPQETLLAIKRSEEAVAAATPVAAGIDIAQLRFNYAISGDTPQWRPLRAFDDGRQTYIEFPASLAVDQAPPLFLVGSKGEAQLVNFRLRGRYYVVDRLSAHRLPNGASDELLPAWRLRCNRRHARLRRSLMQSQEAPLLKFR